MVTASTGVVPAAARTGQTDRESSAAGAHRQVFPATGKGPRRPQTITHHKVYRMRQVVACLSMPAVQKDDYINNTAHTPQHT